MLKHLRLQHFKSFEDQEVDLAPLTFLVGANASGKSNFLDAVRFLEGVGLQLSLSEIVGGRLEGGREVWPGIRGGSAEIYMDRRAPTVGLESTWSGDSSLVHGIACVFQRQGRLEPAVLSEHLIEDWGHGPNSDHFLFRSVNGAITRRLGILLDSAGKGPALRQEFDRQKSVLGRIPAITALHPRVLTAQAELLQLMSNLTFLELDPRQMREYVPKQTRELGVRGQNLSGVIWNLAQDPDMRQNIVDWISELSAPVIDGLDFTETKLGDVLMGVLEHNGVELSVRSLSDGTLRFLGVLAAVLTAQKNSILVIDEIETGLHPSRVNLLTELLVSHTRTRRLQVIATTHSPQLLQGLPIGTLEQAVLFARLPETEGSIIRRLGQLPNFEEIVKKRGFEHLFTTRWLERAV